METQDSSLKHLKERRRKHQLAQASTSNIVQEHLLPITASEGNILLLVVFLKLPCSLLCKTERCGRDNITGLQVTWSHPHTTEKIKTSPHAWNTMSEGRSSAACIDPRTQYYSIQLDIGYFNIDFHEDFYPFRDHQLELKYKVRECNFIQKRGNPLAEVSRRYCFVHSLDSSGESEWPDSRGSKAQ